MTTTTTVHVNGRYKATIKRTPKEGEPTLHECHGNYEGSPNPTGAMTFSPGLGQFDVTEEVVPPSETLQKQLDDQ